MQPPTYSPSFWKSSVKRGFSPRIRRTKRYMRSRCSGVGMSSAEAPRPTGMKWKYQQKSAPFSIIQSMFSSVATASALARVQQQEMPKGRSCSRSRSIARSILA